MFDQIRQAVHDAALRCEKMAMFHFQVLKFATALDRVDPASFCRTIGVPEAYQTEFRKMLNLARVMREQGARLP